MNHPSDKVVLQSPEVLINQHNQILKSEKQLRREALVNRSTADMKKILNYSKIDLKPERPRAPAS
jgi:hypothetical protein